MEARLPLMAAHRIYQTAFVDIYPHYVTKIERKARTPDKLAEVIEWLTGYSPADVQRAIDDRVTMEQFFGNATINPNASLITGSICGYRVQEIDDDLMRNIRYLDKLVDELAKGRPLAKILRSS